MYEFNTIAKIREFFPASPRQKNAVFTCDAELVELNGGLYGITVDEFSAEEDFFADHDPASLGQDLAVATLSDLLAAGCKPAFYLHTIAAPYGREKFATQLAQGVQEILQQAGCFLLGGDLGQNANWRYTGVAIGTCANGRGLKRILPNRPQKLWLTGALGAGNLQALGYTAARFNLRLEEAQNIRELATTCIDTSGGLMESLQMLARVNPATAFYVDSWALPYAAAVCSAALRHQLPTAAFAFGAAGEYELLFTTETGMELDWAANIGVTAPDVAGNIYWDGQPLTEPPAARAFPDKKAYIAALREYLAWLK